MWTTTLSSEPFAIVGDRLFAWDSTREGIVELDAATGRELRFRTIGGASFAIAPRSWLPIPGGYVADDGNLTQIREHAGALSAMWTVRAGYLSDLVVAGDTVIGMDFGEPSAMFALGLLDGKPRWRVPRPAAVKSLRLAGDASALVMTYDRDRQPVIAALDPASGATRWSLDLPYEPGELALGTGGFAVATGKHALALYDAATGHATAVPLESPYPSLLVDAGIAYVVDDRAKAIAAYRIRDGTLVWRVDHEVGLAHLSVHDRLLVIATYHATMIALDRATGALQWEIGTGVDDKVFVGDRVVVAVGGSRVVGFTQPATRPVPERATIRGRVSGVACGVIRGTLVDVGEQRVEVDEDGRFTAEIRALGVVLVGGFAVRLTGAGDYTVPDLELNHCPLRDER